MASGHLTLILREGGGWHGFEAFADAFLSPLGAAATSRADSPVDRVWTVHIRGEEFWLAFDDWHNRYELSARSAEGDAILTELAAQYGGSADP
jgi:hypothetical protein